MGFIKMRTAVLSSSISFCMCIQELPLSLETFPRPPPPKISIDFPENTQRGGGLSSNHSATSSASSSTGVLGTTPGGGSFDIAEGELHCKSEPESPSWDDLGHLLQEGNNEFDPLLLLTREFWDK